MARKVTTEYRCDACSVEVKTVRDLQRFRLAISTRGRKADPVAATDLCGDCESALLGAVQAFFPVEELPELHAMGRVDE
jgi:hypothetical protein